MNFESASDRTGAGHTLKRLVPAVVIIGLLGYLAYLVTLGSGTLAFYQIGIVVGTLVYLLTFMDLMLGLAFFIACIGLSPEVTLGSLTDLRLEDFIIPALLLAWLTRAAQTREPFAPTHIKAPLLLYFSALLASTGLGLAMETTEPFHAFIMAAKYAEYLAVFLLIVNTVKKEGEFRALVIFALLVAMAAALLSAQQLATVAGGTTGRVVGPAGETANIFGGYLVLNISVLVGLFLHLRSGPARFGLGTAIVLLGVALLYTYSRTSYVALAVGLVAFGIFRERRMIVLVVMLVFILPLLMPESVQQRMATILQIGWDAGPPSYEARLYAWKMVAASVFSGNPLFGFGLGSVRLGDVDSEYFRILSDGGVLGLGAFIWLLVRVYRTTCTGYAALPAGGFHKGFAAGYWIAFISICAHALAATSFTAIRTMETFLVFSALFVVQVNTREEWMLEDEPVRDRAPVPVPPVTHPTA